jgi:hypothetical protein
MYALSGAAEASSVEVPLAVEIDPLEYSLTRSACDAKGRRARRPVPPPPILRCGNATLLRLSQYC